MPRTDDKAEGGTGRLKAFSDGVFALAITLLVLDLKIPALIRVTPTALADALADMWPSYLTLIFGSVRTQNQRWSRGRRSGILLLL